MKVTFGHNYKCATRQLLLLPRQRLTYGYCHSMSPARHMESVAKLHATGAVRPPDAPVRHSVVIGSCKTIKGKQLPVHVVSNHDFFNYFSKPE